MERELTRARYLRKMRKLLPSGRKYARALTRLIIVEKSYSDAARDPLIPEFNYAPAVQQFIRETRVDEKTLADLRALSTVYFTSKYHHDKGTLRTYYRERRVFIEYKKSIPRSSSVPISRGRDVDRKSCGWGRNEPERRARSLERRPAEEAGTRIVRYTAEFSQKNYEELRDSYQGSEDFERAAFCLWLRYHNLTFGLDEKTQDYTPSFVENWLRKFEVQWDLLASPLRHFAPRFGSLFADTDWGFQSYGNYLCILGAMGLQGIILVHPPAIELMYNRVAEEVLAEMRKENRPLGALFVMAPWQDCTGWQALQTSSYFRKKIEEKASGSARAPDYELYLLMNDTAWKKWQPFMKRLFW